MYFSSVDKVNYCCQKKCFPIKGDQVDGIACQICCSFSYCQCNCETFKAKQNNKNSVIIEYLKTQLQLLIREELQLKYSRVLKQEMVGLYNLKMNYITMRKSFIEFELARYNE
jgi:hypothetical protein